MKKLLMGLALAASVAGFGNDICAGGQGPTVTGAQRAYTFKASVKMVDGKVGTSTSKGTICVGGTTSSAYYRVKATRKFKGVFIDCDVCQINAIKAGDVDEVVNKKAGDNLAMSKAYFFVSTSDSKYKAIYSAMDWIDDDDMGYKFDILNWFGGPTFAKSKLAEGLAQFNIVELDKFGEYRLYSLFAAGFGKRDGDLLKSLKGNLAGAVTAATWCGILTQVFEPCLETPYYDSMTATGAGYEYEMTPWQVPQSPAYDAVSGKWSVKYSKSLSKLATMDAVLGKVFGSGAYVITDDEADTYHFPFEYAELYAE